MYKFIILYHKTINHKITSFIKNIFFFQNFGKYADGYVKKNWINVKYLIFIYLYHIALIFIEYFNVMFCTESSIKQIKQKKSKHVTFILKI